MTDDRLAVRVTPHSGAVARSRRQWISLFALLALLIVAGGVQAPSSRAADAIFANGLVSDAASGGTFGSWVNLTQIDVRSLDGHSSCWRAYDGSVFTNAFCTNALDGSAYGGVYRTPHCFSGWTGHTVEMRCRQYW